MVKVVVGGASGKLGRTVCLMISERAGMELVGGVVSPGGPHVGAEILPGVRAVSSERLEEALRGAEVYVDLTSPAAAEENLPRVPATGVNMVVGTTGISDQGLSKLREEVRRHGVSAVVSPNFSIGVNLFWKTCRDLAAVMEGYDIEIIEVHHRMKKDAPSGTAMRAAEIISEVTGIDRIAYGREGKVGARGREIGIHAVRAGDVVGEHTVLFAGKKERIELTHRAHSREAFAEGCLTAIEWVAGRRDGEIHTMEEVLGI